MLGIIGGGRVGLTVALACALKNKEVIIIERDDEKIFKINRNILPFYDKSFESIPLEALRRIVAVSVPDALKDCNPIIICTPENAVEHVIESIIDFLNDKLVIIKSTLPLGFMDEVIVPMIERKYKIGENVFLAYIPEFIRMGTALHDFLKPDRVIIGVKDERSKELALGFVYEIQEPKNIFVTDFKTAELAKLASNAFLAMKISFINEISILAKCVGVNPKALRILIGSDRRIGEEHLNPGIGFGGSCLPKDLEILIREFAKRNITPRLLLATKEINDLLHVHFYNRLVEVLGSLKGKKIAVLGLSFKPGTDDVRNTPARKVISVLINNGCEVYAYDPVAIENFKKTYKINSVKYCKSLEEAIKNVDAIVIVTDWDEFRNIKTDKPVIDLRGINVKSRRYFGLFW